MAGLWKHFKDGSWGMYPIVIVSIFAIGIIIERALYLYGASINKDVFLATMQKCILAGDVAKAVKMCSAANAPLASPATASASAFKPPNKRWTPFAGIFCSPRTDAPEPCGSSSRSTFRTPFAVRFAS